MLNPLYELAGGDVLFVIMLPMWADNVSRNKLKQYNKHMNMYMANSNLPGQLLQQEYFVRFVSTSLHTGSLEQFPAIKEKIQYISCCFGSPNLTSIPAEPRTQMQVVATMLQHVGETA
jgi:hypothetical protein